MVCGPRSSPVSPEKQFQVVAAESRCEVEVGGVQARRGAWGHGGGTSTPESPGFGVEERRREGTVGPV